jgi:hypothetical protein
VTKEAIADALLAAAHAARGQTRAEFDACREEALRHTWTAAMSPVSAEFEELVR